jgi:2-oxo-4-hydroxy-4-carboxy--5-ureidoimidazoline (OHCU) decarboxylase
VGNGWQDEVEFREATCWNLVLWTKLGMPFVLSVEGISSRRIFEECVCLMETSKDEEGE